MEVSQEQATHMTRELARVEGIFAGMSSGGGVHAALRLIDELAEQDVPGATIVCIICDRGDRYLSSGLFER